MSIVVMCECGKRLRADESCAGKRVRCTRCGEVVTLPDLPELPLVSDPQTEAAVYYLVRDSQKSGPFTIRELRRQQLQTDSLVWRAGMSEWRTADRVPELAHALPTMPPPLPETSGSRRSRKEKRQALYDPNAFEAVYNWFRGSVIPGTIGCAVLTFLPGASLVSSVVYNVYLLIAEVFCSILLYKSWNQIQDDPARTTPGKAVGFMYIPFFCVYWNFVAVHGLALDLNRYAAKRGLALRPISETLAMTWCVMAAVDFILCWIPIVGFIFGVIGTVMLLLLLHQVKDASKVIATAKLVGRSNT